MPEDSRLVGYADDVAAFVAAPIVEQSQSRLSILMRWVMAMTGHDFNLALEKDEVVILTRRRIQTLRPISIGELTIALRVAFAYRTVSEPAAMVIVGVIPVALLDKERKAIYRRKVVAREKRQRTLTEWQFSWQNEPRGAGRQIRPVVEQNAR